VTNEAHRQQKLPRSKPLQRRWLADLDWLAEQLKATGVDVRLGIEPTVDDVLALSRDVVVIATGSVLRSPAWAANAPTPVIDADDVANTPQPEGPGKTVMLVDDEGGFAAATAAEALTSAGWSVRIATTPGGAGPLRAG
jgi:hypothetical protein